MRSSLVTRMATCFRSNRQRTRSVSINYRPGRRVYYQMLEDLYIHRPARLVSFGTGVNPHKLIFSNRKTFDSSVYIVRPTLGNRFQMTCYSIFCDALKLAKRLSKMGSSADEAEAGE